MTEPMKTSIDTMAKLGSIIVHLEEYSETNESTDLDAAQSLLGDPAVLEVMGMLRGMALLPLKRNEDIQK